MCVHVADRDRDPWSQPGQLGHLLGKTSSPLAQRVDVTRELLVHHVAQPGVERGEEIAVRVPLSLVPDGLVARRTGIAFLLTSELEHDPVRPLEVAVGRLVDLGVLIERLPDLGEEPFGGNLAAVQVKPSLTPLAGDLVQAVGLGLRGVVLPNLDPGVGIIAPLRLHTQRRAHFVDGQHRASSEIGADANDVLRIHPTLPQHNGDGLPQHLNIVLWILQGKVGRQRFVAAR